MQRHCDAETLAACSVVELTLQAVQLPAPVFDFHQPIAHAEHATPSLAALLPAKHLQSFIESEPADELVFCGQALHAPLPNPLLKLAAGQMEQPDAPPLPMKPPWQTQSLIDLLPREEVAPFEQAEQAKVSLVATERRRAPVQACGPAVDLNVAF